MQTSRNKNVAKNQTINALQSLSSPDNTKSSIYNQTSIQTLQQRQIPNNTVAYFRADAEGRDKSTKVLDHAIKLKRQTTLLKAEQ